MRVRTEIPLVLIALSPWISVTLMPSDHGAAGRGEPAAGARLQLAPAGQPGDRLVMTGRIVDAAGKPVPGATLSVYHAGANGDYAKHGATTPRLFGTVRVGGDGGYRIETVVQSQIRSPEGGAPDIQGTVSAPGRPQAGFVVNLRLARGRHQDAWRLASAGGRHRRDRTVYQDRKGTWWLVYDPMPSVRG